MKYIKAAFLYTFLFFSFYCFSQDVQVDEQLVKVGNEMYKFGDYKDATDVYLQALAINSSNAEANLMAGLCYLKSSTKQNAVPYLIKAKSLNPNISGDIDLHIGNAYQVSYEFDKAIEAFEDYRERIVNDYVYIKLNSAQRRSEEAKIDRKIYECENGKSYLLTPVKVTTANLSSMINSAYKDYAPIVNTHSDTIYFTSRRKGSTGNNKDKDNDYFEDIYMSTKVNGAWTEAQNLGAPINSAVHESCIGVSKDGNTIYLYVDNEKIIGDIYQSTKLKNGSWTSPISVSKLINTPFIENSVCFSPDGKTLIFSSNKPGGKGGQDLYYCLKDYKGNWSTPINLGAPINSEYDDECPGFAPDGKTLYFSSKGHKGMGGFDIYKTQYDSTTKQWSKVENLKYPINTPDDDMYFFLDPNENKGYYSTVKADGLGESDLYDIDLSRISEIDSSLLPKDSVFATIIKLQIIDKETKEVITGATIEVLDNNNKAIAKTVFETNVGIVNLSEFEFNSLYLSIEKEGYLFQDVILSKATSKDTVYQTIQLEKAEIGHKYILKNIYYNTNEYTLKEESFNSLNSLVKLLNNNPTLKIEVGSHTDNVGEHNYNVQLSQKRAESVVTYLLSKGIESKRVIAKGYGETQPIASNDDEKDGREVNRRTEITFISK
jgi:outer membrane protein OmpA-like peptidoglycan-associated protein/tetratricopeptide (TPR) repeat protein